VKLEKAIDEAVRESPPEITQNKRPAFLLRRQAGLKTKPLKLRGA
jgi:hypothetical protein